MKDNLLFLKNLKGKPGTDKIRKQAQVWDMYAKTAPFIFMAIAGILWALDIVHHSDILYTALGIFVLTAVTWWFWTVHTIGHIANMLRDADDGIEDTLKDLRDIKKLVKQLRD